MKLRVSILLRAVVVLFCASTSTSWSQPAYDLRPLAEFEPQEGVIIGWYELGSYGPSADTMWARAVQEIGEVATAYVCVRYSSAIGPIQNFLISLGISLENVEFMATGTMFNVWVRDYGPEFTYMKHGDRIIVEGGYYQDFPQYLANLWGLEHYHAPISMQGGNYMTDGACEISVSGAYVSDPSFWQQTVRSYFDLPLHVVPELPGEPCGHIDMYARFVSPDRVVINQYDDPTYNDNMDLAQAAFEARGCEVFRLPTPPVASLQLPRNFDLSKLHLPPDMKPPTGGQRFVYKTYTNGIQCNGKYLLPVYDHPFDAQAKDVFELALPDHEIIPINCNAIIIYGGALHCTSSDVQTTGIGRPAPLTVTAAGSDVTLGWPSVSGAVAYEIYRRVNPQGYELHLNDFVASTSSTSWTDIGVFDQLELPVYQILAVAIDGSRSVLSPRRGGAYFVADISPR
jgi:agmatine/peptidylarginine deiminase